jgi:hypothetical protein
MQPSQGVMKRTKNATAGTRHKGKRLMGGTRQCQVCLALSMFLI